MTKVAAALRVLSLVGLGLVAGGCTKAAKPAPNNSSLEQSPVGEQLKRFVAEKEAQATAGAKAEGTKVLPEYKAMFAAAAKGDWPTISNIWENLRARAPQYADLPGRKDQRLHGIGWQTMLEIWGSFGPLAVGEEKYVVRLGSDTIESIAPGSIYFGGTDPGRCVITALQKSHVQGDPFFTITQNALADTNYLAYVRSMYAGRIYTATEQDSQQCFQEYLQDAQKRLQHDQQFPNEPKQIKPGEEVKIVGNRVQVEGQVAVMAINALITKLIFDKNPATEFYVEESFPLDWMYPHLSPNGPIMKINRQPVSVLSDDTLRRDHNYWTNFFQEMIGDWLNYDTPVEKVAAFAREKHGTHPKPDRFNHPDDAERWVSKLRASIAGVYAWRAQKTTDDAEKARMVREADFAFRQALAVCPYSPEVVFRYVNLLFAEKRFADAVVVVELATNMEPADDQFRNLLKVTRDLKAQQTPK